MLFDRQKRGTGLAVFALFTVCAMASMSGCTGGAGDAGLLGSPFFVFSENAGGGLAAPPTGTTTMGGGGSFGGDDRTNLDPCDESQARKFVRISMRNLVPDDNIHYFLALIALVNSATHPDGAVCPDDIPIYTAFGYREIVEGATASFGNYCIRGPALLYFHENGEFRAGDGSLASGIEPSRGTGATFDQFFGSAGKLVPVPNQILFHNPGTGSGFQLKVAATPADACTTSAVLSNCGQDAFYYVDDNDLPGGSTALGVGSSRRVPAEIQGTGCECGLAADGFQVLAPSNATASNANCNEFLRGGTINYAFVRDDLTPPFPQLVWQVTDGSASIAHEFDSRAGIQP